MLSFYFPLLLDNKTAKTGTSQIQVLQERPHGVLRYFAIKISTKNNALEEQGLSFFFKYY